MAFNTWEEQALGLLPYLPLCGAAHGKVLSVGTYRPVGKNVAYHMAYDHWLQWAEGWMYKN